MAQAGNHAHFDQWVRVKPILDRRGRDVFAFGGFEQFFDTAGDLQQAIGTAFATVASAEIAVRREHFSIQIRALVVAHQLARGLNQNLALCADLDFHTRKRQAHAPRRIDFGCGVVRVSEVFRHRITLYQVQAQPPVPSDQLGGNRCRSTASQQCLVQAQVFEHLAFDDAAQNRNAQQTVKLFGRHLGKNALLELEPQARHRDKSRGPRAVQILDEGVQRFGKEDVGLAIHHGGAFHPGPFEHMGQWQVRQDAVVINLANTRLDVFGDVFADLGDALKAMHHTLGCAGGA